LDNLPSEASVGVLDASEYEVALRDREEVEEATLRDPEEVASVVLVLRVPVGITGLSCTHVSSSLSIAKVWQVKRREAAKIVRE